MSLIHGLTMLRPLIDSDGQLFGWLCEGDLYDPAFDFVAFSSGDDFFAIGDRRWLGPTSDGVIYDRNGRAVGVPPGMLPLSISKSRLVPLAPRIAPVCSPLPINMRQIFDIDRVAPTRSWNGLKMKDWLGQY